MIIENGKIKQCTDIELYGYYLSREIYLCGISYYQYRDACMKHGTKVIFDIKNKI